MWRNGNADDDSLHGGEKVVNDNQLLGPAIRNAARDRIQVYHYSRMGEMVLMSPCSNPSECIDAVHATVLIERVDFERVYAEAERRASFVAEMKGELS